MRSRPLSDAQVLKSPLDRLLPVIDPGSEALWGEPSRRKG